MSENGEAPYKKRKADDMSSLQCNMGRQPKSLYTVQNNVDQSELMEGEPEESEERK
jgi:hypothetical protein